MIFPVLNGDRNVEINLILDTIKDMIKPSKIIYLEKNAITYNMV